MNAPDSAEALVARLRNAIAAKVIPISPAALVAETLRISAEEQLREQLHRAWAREAELCDKLDALGKLAHTARHGDSDLERTLAASNIVAMLLAPEETPVCPRCPRNSPDGQLCGDCVEAMADMDADR